MGRVIVIRSYKPGDEVQCRDLIKSGVMSSLNSTFFGTIFKEITFQLMILFAAMMFIFFGLPFSICLLVIPSVISLVYIGTYLIFTMKAVQVGEELSHIPRVYMSNAFSCFWVAEVLEPCLSMTKPKDTHYTIFTEEQFSSSKHNGLLRTRKIVGTIALTKSHRLDKGAWIRRLCVHKQYRRKGVGASLLNVAVQFALEQGYSCVNVVASEYTEGGRELCLGITTSKCLISDRSSIPDRFFSSLIESITRRQFGPAKLTVLFYGGSYSSRTQ